MTRSLLALGGALPLLLAFNCSGDSKPSGVAAAARAAVGAAAGGQGEMCSLLSPTEVKQFFGTAVEKGESAAMGTGCQWAAASNDTAFAQMQILSDTSGYGTPIQAPSYQKLTGIDGVGFSVKDPQGGWRAEAKTPRGHYAVQLIGAPSATREGAVAMLKKLLEKR
jgi:hypothetical protein